MAEPDVLPEIIERFLDHPVAPPPLDELRTAGDTEVRRRRRRGVLASCAAVLVITGGVIVGQVAFGPDDHTPAPEPDVAAPNEFEPPAGTRWAGIGRVVVAVPEGWSDGQVRCNQPTGDTVYFHADVSRLCKIIGPYSSLAMRDRPFADPPSAPIADGEVSGHPVQLAAPGCAEPVIMTCSLDISVPDLDAYFRVTLHGRDVYRGLDAVRDSLTVLPEGQVAIPDVHGRAPDIAAALEEVGLEPIVETSICPYLALCMGGIQLDPGAGHVVPIGSSVTISVLVYEGPEPAVGLVNSPTATQPHLR